MNQLKRIFTAVFCTAAALVVLTASAQNAKQGFATCVRVEGIVTYSLGVGQPESPLVAGKYLPAGAIIYTKDNGVCDLILGKSIDLPQARWSPERVSLAADSNVRGYVTYKPSADQNAIRLTPDSTLAIDKLMVVDTGSDSVSDTELDLKKGKIYASVRKLSGASQYLVKIPTGVAGVRGTLFSISVDGSVACFESHGGGVILALTLPGGATQTFVIAAGMFLNPVTGAPAQISPQVGQVLKAVFNAIRTTYFQQVSYEYDHCGDHFSTTTGNHDNGQGQNQQ
ncbi:MAG TPA: FecR family protein [Verrucomicrobiae bacterium]